MVPVTRIASEMIDFLHTTNGKPIASTFVGEWTMKIVIASSFGKLTIFIIAKSNRRRIRRLFMDGRHFPQTWRRFRNSHDVVVSSRSKSS